MKLLKNRLIYIIAILLVGAFLLILSLDSKKNPGRTDSPITTFEDCVVAGNPVQESYPRGCNANGKHFVEDVQIEENYKDLISLQTPLPNSVITNPLEIRGAARGTWFFEATFPIVLTNWDGLIIAEGYAEAVLDPTDPNSTWMTEDFVAYKATLEFTDPSWDDDFSKRGSLILQKSNPSGLPENADAFEVPIRFQ